MFRLASMLCVVSLLLLSGCGKSSAGGVAGTAKFYKGLAGTRSEFPSPPPPADDRTSNSWILTPDKITMTITAIGMMNGSTFGPGSPAAVSCPITWQRSTGASLSKLLDCPFSVPAGTYTGVSIAVANQVKVTINDAVHNIYTNDSSPSKLSSTGPAAEVTINTCKSCPASGVQTFNTSFPSSVTFDSTHPPSVSIVFDPVQWLSTFPGTATFGDEPFTSTGTSFPLIPSTTAVAKVEYYSNAGTLDSFQQSTRAPKLGIKVYYTSDTAPARVDMIYGTAAFGCGASNIASSAWPASHKTSPASGSGIDKYFGGGGYLGLKSGTLAWALPTEFDYATWAVVMTLPETTTVGASAALTFACTSAAPDPVSGDTYASGLPTFTPSAGSPINLTLAGK